MNDAKTPVPARTDAGNRLDPARIGLVLALSLAALALRLLYAYGLPLDMDETFLLDEARKTSILPGSFHLPLIGPASRHSGFVVWLIAAANWALGPSLFGIRSVFALLHVGGLFGLFLATRHLFGYRAGVLALAFGAVDRFWIASSAQLLEPSSFFLVPWILLTAYRCVYSPWRGCWWVLGILLAVAVFYYELSVLLALGIAVFLVASPDGRKTLKTLGPYTAAVLALGVVVSIQGWNLAVHRGAWRYAAGVFGTHSAAALSPRVLLLYLADVIIPFRDASILTLSIGIDFFAPFHMPCHWAAGLFCLICVAYSLRFWRDNRVAFLLACFFCTAAPVSLVPPRELWSNIHYGGQSVVVAIALSGWMAARLLDRRAGRVLVAGLFAWLAASILLFLHGPKRTYCGPDEEMAFVAGTLYGRWSESDENGAAVEDIGAIRRRIDEMERIRPDSLVARYVRWHYAVNRDERIEAVRQARRIDPHAVATALIESETLRDSGDLAGARDCLKAALERRKGARFVLPKLAEIEFALGEYAAAAMHAEQAVKETPNRAGFYRTLILAYDAQGSAEGERRAIEAFLYWCRFAPSEGYAWIAREFALARNLEKAVDYAHKALRHDPRSSSARFALGYALGELGRLDRAEQLLGEIPPSHPTHALAQSYLRRMRQVRNSARPSEEKPSP